jgi:hypothetical protein
LQSWEQYIYPPIEDCLLCGDILVDSTGERSNPESYRLVLTPSCDLQPNKGGVCKVASVLVARGCPIKRYTDSLNEKADRLEEKLPRYLSEAQRSGYIPVPKYADLVPSMAVSLRDLELIPMSEIATKEEEKRFRRILSIDSPFREQVSWGYMQIACRPGLPERELAAWAREIVATK